MTDIDPLFLFIHLIERHCDSKYRNLQDIITEESLKDYELLREGADTLDLTPLCDVQEVLDHKYFKFNL